MMKKKKVLGIYGSPREGGNSDLLLDAALEGARAAGAEVSAVYVRDLQINGCKECGGCDRTGKCVQKDEMQKVYPLLEEADVILLGTPVFFYSFPAQVKALIDRAQALWAKKLLEGGTLGGKETYRGKGYLLAVGATRGKNLFEGMELTARYFFDALNKAYEPGILVRKMDAPGVIKEHPEYLQQARELGEQAARE